MRHRKSEAPTHFAARILEPLLLKGDVDSVASVSVRQLVGSGMTTVVDVALFYLLIRFQLVGILTAAALSFCCALVLNYAIASSYVFRHRTGGKIWRIDRFVLYALSALISLGINQAIIWLLSVRFSFHPLIGKFAAVAILFFWNQWISRRILFNGKMAEKIS